MANPTAKPVIIHPFACCPLESWKHPGRKKAPTQDAPPADAGLMVFMSLSLRPDLRLLIHSPSERPRSFHGLLKYSAIEIPLFSRYFTLESGMCESSTMPHSVSDIPSFSYISLSAGVMFAAAAVKAIRRQYKETGRQSGDSTDIPSEFPPEYQFELFNFFISSLIFAASS